MLSRLQATTCRSRWEGTREGRDGPIPWAWPALPRPPPWSLEWTQGSWETFCVLISEGPCRPPHTPLTEGELADLTV